MTNKYRIVRDGHKGYEVQFQYWWFPFVWIQCDDKMGKHINTFSSLEEAKSFMVKHRNGLIDYVVYPNKNSIRVKKSKTTTK